MHREQTRLVRIWTRFRRRWTIVVFTLGGFFVAAVLATLKAPTYTATARIQLTAEGFAGPRVRRCLGMPTGRTGPRKVEVLETP